MKSAALVILFVSVIFICYTDSTAQIEIEVDRKEVWIGDPIQLTVILERSEDSIIKAPEIEKYIQNFELKDFKITEKKLAQKKIQTILVYTLSSFQTGEFTLGPISIQLQSQTSGSQELNTKPIIIQVKSLVDPNLKSPDIRGPKPPLNLKKNLLWIYLFLVVLLLLGISVWALFRTTNLFERPEAKFLTPSMGPDEEAIVRLEELSRSNELKEGKMKVVYTLLSEILRQYLSRRFQLDALEMTTFECIRDLKKQKVNFDIFERIKTILNESDLVKFAKLQPDLKLALSHIENTKDIIYQTKEKPFET